MLFTCKGKWIKMIQAVCVQRASYTFYVPQKKAEEQLLSRLAVLDQEILQGKKLKDSKTTTAVLSAGTPPLFIKRTNNKNLSFTLRYLFRPARSFRAAYAVELFKRLAIPTPEVFAAGESRSGLILNGGYLVTESVSGLEEIQTILAQSADPLAEIRKFFASAAALMKTLHAAKIIHGDLKIQNFYLQNGVYGIWDLDGVRQYRKKLPRKKITEELALTVASARIALEQNPAIQNITENMPDPSDLLAGILLEHYGAENGISRSAVAEAAGIRYVRMMNRYFGKRGANEKV